MFGGEGQRVDYGLVDYTFNEYNFDELVPTSQDYWRWYLDEEKRQGGPFIWVSPEDWKPIIARQEDPNSD